MKEYFSMEPNKRQEITGKIKQVLLKERNIVFAFLFGSFLDSPSFRDIDIGIYVDNLTQDKVFDYEVELSKKIADGCGLPFDIFEVNVLNLAPSSFLNDVFARGQLLFSKNDSLLSDMIENNSLEAIANEYIALQSLKELIPIK